MNNELDKLLCERYPKIFAQRHGNMRETCMCWGLDISDTWFDIIDVLCRSIQWHIDQRIETIERANKHNYQLEQVALGNRGPIEEHYRKYLDNEKNRAWALQSIESDIARGIWNVPEAIPQVVAVQVKEKFGTLRFYYDGGDPTIDGMVRIAEAMSSRVCEKCGASGKVIGGGWVQTLCKTHAEEAGKIWPVDEE